MGELTPLPQPEVLGRNGTYLVFHKLHTRLAVYPPVPPCQGN
jgi:hypothetical protein